MNAKARPNDQQVFVTNLGNYVKGGAGATKFSQLSTDLDFDIPGKQTLTLAAISTGGTATVDSSLQWRADF